MKELLKDIRDNNILLEVVDGELKVFVTESAVDPTLLAAIRDRKLELVQFLSNNDQAVSGDPIALYIPPVPEQPDYALSSAQRRLWLLSQTTQGSLAYHMPKAYTLEGELNTEALAYALNKLTERHECLRTVFKENRRGEIRQWILPACKDGFKLDHYDLREDLQQENRLKELVRNEWRKPFDLSAGPLIRASLLQVTDHKWIFTCVMHHIISDGWSMGIMIKEILLLYNARISGQEYPLAPLPIQYKDYAAWQQAGLKEGVLHNHKAYWLNRLKDDLPVLALPIDRPRPALMTFNGDAVIAMIDGESLRGLLSILNDRGATLFMGLLAAVKALLYRYTGQDDIIIGSPIAGRDHMDVEGQIGFFVNTLALRSRFKGSDDYLHLLEIMKETTLSAYAHQSYPFDELVTELNLQRDMSRNALFDVMVALQNEAYYKMPEAEPGSLVLSTYDEDDQVTCKLDLSFIFMESEAGLRLKVEYNTDIYNRITVVRLVNHLGELLKSVIERPSTPICLLDYLTGDEKFRLLNMFNDTTVDFPRDQTIITLFEQQAARTPAGIAIVFEGREITYRELNELSNKLGHYLRINYHIVPDDLVGIKLDRSDWMVIAILGVLKSGGAYMPVDPDYPADRVLYMIRDSKCKLVIDESELNIFREKEELYDTTDLQPVNKPGDLAYVIYTSGTTGEPKGSLIEHRSVVRLFKNEKALFDFDATDTWTMFHSYCFDFSVWEMYGALLHGGKLIIVPLMTARDPAAFLELLTKNSVTVLNQTPSSFYNLIQYELENREPGMQLKYVIFGGEALSPVKLKEWRERYPDTRLVNMYGITETTVHVTYKEIKEEEIRDNSRNIGRPIPTLKCYVLDPCLNLLPIGAPGELYVGGAGLSRGYLNRADLTDQRFVINPFAKDEKLYRSGDIVRFVETGEMEYVGRIDDQIKIRGYRVEPGEISAMLQKYDGVDEAVVIARTNREGAKELVAYVTGRDNLQAEDMRSWMSRQLPGYMVPVHFVRLAEWPLTSNGKLDKKNLPEPQLSGEMSDFVCLAPRNPREEKLVAILEELLGRKGIGINDHFFSIGGDSIRAITFIVNIQKEFGVKIKVKTLYENPTIASLSACLPEPEDEKTGNEVFEYLSAGLEEIEKIKILIEEEDRGNNKLPEIYEDIYPVVPIEQGMIYSSLLRPGEPVYYDQYSFILHIDDFDRFIEGLYRLVRRHSILRTRYYLSSFSRPVKVVMPEITLPISYQDISALSKTERMEKINSFIGQDLATRLTFDDELLWRINVFRLEGNEHYLTYSFHHALLDGWSVSVIKTEIANFNGNDLPPLKHSYRDYCAIALGRKRANDTERYWKDMLQGYTRNKLPFNYKGLRINEETGMRKTGKTIPKELLLQLNTLAENHRLSFKAVCLAAHVFLLHVICSEQDITTGVVTHERPEIEGGEDIVGCFLTTIPIRIEFDTLTDIQSLLYRVNDFLTGVKGHEAHLSEIAKMIGDKTSFGNPVFDTLLNYTDFHSFGKLNKDAFIDILGAGEDASDLIISHEMTNTLFDVEVGKTLDRFSMRIKYAPGYFTGEDAGYALELYVRILECFVRDVHTPLASLNLLTESEFRKIMVDFNCTEAPYAREKTLHQLFEEQVARTPHAIALRQDGAGISYSDLNQRANRLAAYLIEQGLRKEENIGLLTSRNFDMIIGMYGILKAGGCYVPIDPEYPRERQQYIVHNSGVGKIVTDDASRLTGKWEGIRIISIDHEGIAGCKGENPEIGYNSQDLAYTIYTSGSTGRPKGVMIRHHSAVNLVEWVNDTYHIGPEDRLLFITSMCFDLSVYDVFGMLAAGGTVVIARNEEVQQIDLLKELMTKERITFWDSVPTTMSYFTGELEAGHETYCQSDLRLVFLSGDWIPVQLPDRIRQFFPAADVVSLGGATEATVWSNYYLIGKVNREWSSIPYGKPIKNNFFYILNKWLNPVPRGVAGELYIGGAGVARSYANDPEMTAASFIPDPFNSRHGGAMYKTGDLGRMLPDGNMEFLGRKDNQVKIRGFRVELGEIESVLQRHESIKGAIVDTYKDAGDMNQLCAYLTADRTPDLPAIRDYLKEHIPFYMVPHHFIVLESFPLNSNGKINRKALPRPDERPTSFLQEHIAPFSDIQVKVERIWRAILNVERIGLHDDLFELGANSLSVGAFVNRIHREMDLTLNIRILFAAPTIEAIASEIEKIRWASGNLIEMDNTQEIENFSI